ncbi:MAG: SIS domain-containing protein [Marinospirillum sp.]|uniref:SIS domain-containing protein n=1 Tax=Marinospirillum sp. TaxID=2183934 RepID=UPI001A096F53|nr:SIS domain-containing protein [Marinospirillum sp.]MBE0506881.1 SIS domain-containing protein [Marinospirillum sp.]
MHLDLIKQELAAEQEALTQITTQLHQGMEDFLETLLQCQGRIVVCALAQNQEAGRKAFTALAQAETPCVFVYSDETFKPDVELIFPEDTLLVLSLHGDSEAHRHLLRLAHENKNTLTAITGNAESPLARVARRHLTASSAENLATLGHLLARAYTRAKT